VFDDELKKAGFRAEAGEALFEEASGSADLKVGVLIDDIKGRFCEDCPSLLNPKGIPATVVMTAHWEVYSALDRKVVARVTTAGGAEYRSKLQGSILPAVLEGFRENVRQLIASDDFRRLVTRSPGAAGGVAASGPVNLTPIALVGPATRGTVAQASKSVAVVYAADGQGSGFLVSSEGYLITNQHVVGGSKYVKLKWSDGAETVGEVLRADTRRDVALIKTEAKGRAPLALRLGPVQQGETVFAIGTPLDDKLQNTMTKGIVSAERMDQGLRYIQSDVTVNHGNSGGPLIDDKSQVIALTVSGRAPNGSPIGLNFFIPIEDALKALALTPAA
jgi:S1-C subfamily serine protease